MQDPMTPLQIYSEHGFFLAKNFVPRFLSDYLKQIVHTQHINLCTNTLYGDPALDTFALMSTPLVSQITSMNTSVCYSECRIYTHDDHVLPHMDAPHLSHTVTMFLGGEYQQLWPMWIQKPDVHKTPQLIALEEGDAVIYQGNQVHHWRDHFEGTNYYELTMHFVESHGAYAHHKYDSRPYIGLPKSTCASHEPPPNQPTSSKSV